MGSNIHYSTNNVNGGEISNQLDGRVETEKYRASARILENFIVKPYGAISKRPGTEFLNETKNNKVARLEPFKRSSLENYALEFTENNIRIWKDSGAIKINSTDYSTLSVTNWTDSINYSAGNIVYSTSANNLLFYCNTSHSATSANSPLVGSNWSQYWTYKTFEVGDVYNYTTSAMETGLFYCDVKSTNKDNLPGNLNYWSKLENSDGDHYYYDLKTDYLESEIFELQTAQINDVCFLTHKNHYPKILKRIGDSKWTLEDVVFDFAPTLDPNEMSNTVSVIYNYEDWGATDQWTSGTSYISGQRVYGDGNPDYNIYTCLSAHVAGSGSEPGTVGANGVWSLKTYSAGVRVVNSLGDLYTCHTGHTPKRLATDPLYEPGVTTGDWENYWNLGAKSTYTAPAWNVSNGLYDVGTVVSKDGVNYRCISVHHSGSSEYVPGSGSNWTSVWELIPANVDIGTDLEYALQSTANIFSTSDVGKDWIVTVGSPDAFISIDLGTASTGTTTSESVFIQGEYIASTLWDSGVAMLGNLSLQESFDNNTWSTVKSWNVLDVTKGNISYSSEAPATGAWYRLIVDKTSGGNKNFTLEQVKSTNDLNLKITEFVSSSKVVCQSNLTNSQTIPSRLIGEETPIYRTPAFSSINGFPRTVAYHENRVWFSGVDGQPGRLWASASDDYYNFLISTGDTDSLDVTLGSSSTNKILWLKSFNRSLVVGTEGEIFTVDSGENDQSLAPDNIRSKLRTRYGSSTIPAIVTGDSLLFFQRGNKRLREFGYRFESDSYFSPDMTVLSEHIHQGGFLQAAYQTNLEPVLWATTVNGALVGFSYDREQNVTAWHRHLTGNRNVYYNDNGNADKFVSVCTLFATDSNSDQVWFCIKRKINGQWKYYIERFNKKQTDFQYGENVKDTPLSSINSFFDCQKTVSNGVVSATNVSFGGLDYLNGRNVFYNNTLNANYGNSSTLVSGNSATISNGYSAGAIFGIPIYCVYCPSRINFNLDNGDVQGRKTRIDRINFKLWKSNDGGYSFYNNQDYNQAISSVQTKPIETDDVNRIDYSDLILNFNTDNSFLMNDGVAPKTGQTKDLYFNTNWNNSQAIAITHYSPSPFTILSTQFKLEVSGN